MAEDPSEDARRNPYWYMIGVGRDVATVALLAGILQEIVSWRPPEERRAANKRLEGRVISICEQMMGEIGPPAAEYDYEYDYMAEDAANTINDAFNHALGRWHTEWVPARRSAKPSDPQA